jgi:hypothetical protein
MTLAEAYAKLIRTPLGGPICRALSARTSSAALEREILTRYNIRILPESPRPAPAPPLPDDDGWSLEVDHDHQQAGPYGVSTVRAVKLTAWKNGEAIASASAPSGSLDARFSGRAVTAAARKLERKLEKMGHKLRGFRALRRASS